MRRHSPALAECNIGKGALVPESEQAREAAAKSREDTVAVALGYKPERDSAPTVLASGRGPIAEQILEVARARGIHVQEDADLVQLLRVLELGSEIPVAAFAAVAEILIYMYRANGGSPISPHRNDASTAERGS
jgi:flagellar biosynthesis protein